jgi:signal transduction histidine kinase
LAEQVKLEKKIADQRQSLLYEMTLALTSTLDLDDVMDLLLRKITTLLPYSGANITLLNKTTGKLEQIIAWNIDERESESTAAVESDLQTCLLKNAPVVGQKSHDPSSDSFRKERLASYIHVPLVSRDESLGALTFFTSEEHEFNKQEVQFLSTLASQAAIATYNAQLYGRTKDRAAELEQANNEKNESLGVVSHELRQPLNVALGCLSLIKDEIVGNINPEQKKLLEKVIGCSNEQLLMINTLLATTTMESDRIKIDRHKVDLSPFLAELRASHENPLRKELSFVWDYPVNLPIIEIDRPKLKLILQNLINNAVKFTPTGRITISAFYLVDQREIKFTVADTGVGIPKHSLAVIFDKFSQLGSESNTNSGIGLGLHIVKKFTQLLGGRVEVESEVGKGSVFAITLPCVVSDEGR